LQTPWSELEVKGAVDAYLDLLKSRAKPLGRPLKSEKHLKDFYSPQSNEFYELTDIDLLQLYALLTPSEIIKEFGRRSRCEKSIYNLIHKYRLDRPLKARQYLEKIILAACVIVRTVVS